MRLVSQTAVDVIAPALDATASPPPGRYVEVRNSEGEALGRIAIAPAGRATIEVIPEAPGGAFTRAVADSEAFSILLPAPSAARKVAIVDLAVRDTAERIPGPTSLALPSEVDVTEVASFILDVEQ